MTATSAAIAPAEPTSTLPSRLSQDGRIERLCYPSQWTKDTGSKGCRAAEFLLRAEGRDRIGSTARFTDRPTLHPKGFNDRVELPYGLRVSEVKAAVDDIYDFLHNVNRFLVEHGWERLEETLTAATFSGVISELVVAGLSKRSESIIKNQRHNGRPDLVPRGYYEGDGCLQGPEGIEVKASRYSSGWQGHNIESGWIMICQYRVDTTTEPAGDREPTTIGRVLCARLDESDWSFSGRSAGSRRTPTASILRSGVAKLEANAGSGSV